MRNHTPLIALCMILVPAIADAQTDTAWHRAYSAIAPGAHDTIPTAAAEDSPSFKSPSAAFGISFGTTAGLLLAAAAVHHGSSNAPATVLAVGALVVGPAAGYWYGGSAEWKKGLTLRLVATGVGAAGALLALNGGGSGDVGAVMALAGTGVLVVDALVDIAKVSPAVGRANASRGAVAIVPTYDPHGKAPGLAVRLSW